MRRVILLLAILALPTSAEAQGTTDLAVCRAEDEPADRRLEACTKAMENTMYAPPAQLDAQFHRGKAWRDKQEFDRAIEDFQRVALLNRSHGEALLEWGIILRKTKRLEEATAILDRASTLRLYDPRAHYEEGLAYEELKSPLQAMAAFNLAVKYGPEFGSAYFKRGVAWYALGDEARAMEDWSDAIRFKAEEAPAAHVRRGDNWLRKREWDRALLEYEAALKLHPDYADARQGRDQVLRDRRR